MGWTGTHKDPGESVKEFFEGEFNSENGQILDCAVVNLREAYLAYKKYKTGHVEAIVCLLQYDPNDHFNFYYKDMGEVMHPFYYNCPAKILNLLTEPPPFTMPDGAAEWREKCRQQLQKKKRSQKVTDGNVVRFPEPLEFTDGSKVDTFVVTKQNRKTLFRAARQDETGDWKANPFTLYKIPNWKTQDYQVIA